jgi:pimeloyl-ACP methyl ester carboxylesterase
MKNSIETIHYRTVNVDGVEIFYREAGSSKAPTLLLLHGFPSSSHMFRNLIPLLADQYHLVAPDLPGFGFSAAPDRSQYQYRFETLANTIDRFTEMMDVNSYAMYVFDYGAPIGFRLALAHPEKITAIISQNGNAYEEGLSQGWNPIRKYWQEPTAANRAALRNFLTPETTRWQYTHGVLDETLIAPESYQHDSAMLARPGNDEIQLDLFLDYASNVKLYPKFQEYLRNYQPPLLAVWGKMIPFSSRLARKPFNATASKPKHIFLKPVTSRWRRMCVKSQEPYEIFLPGICRASQPIDTAINRRNNDASHCYQGIRWSGTAGDAGAARSRAKSRSCDH